MHGTMDSRYIAIAGNIGVGKSSLVDFLWKEYGLKPIFESQDANPYLADFYRDMKAWAYHSQIFFLTKKFRHYLRLRENRSAQPVVLDRTIYEDAEIFAMNLHRMRLIPKREFTIYWELYETILQVLEPPRVLIYLSCPIRTIAQRIGRRGRSSEAPIKTTYLRRLQTLYDRWIERYTRSPVIRLSTVRSSTSGGDYLDDLLVRKELDRQIRPHV